MKIAVGSDHAGYRIKEAIKKYLQNHNYKFYDFGTHDEQPVDYVDFGEFVAKSVSTGNFSRGILICGTGIGMSIVANKFKGVKAALCHDEFTAKMSREHNDSNVLTIGGRVVDEEKALKIVDIWLKTPFLGGRHERRVDKISLIDEKNFK
ncbi:MAG: ribose 5-phosphate isomerase B [Acidobacteriota bacterium]